MKLILTKSVVITGHPGLAVGDVFEETKQPEFLISIGVAREFVPSEAIKESEEPQTREPVIENREPDIKPKRNKSKLP